MKQTTLVTLADVCLLLQVSSRTVKRMVAKDVLPPPHRMPGFRQLYFDAAKVERAIRRGLK
jgi:predicted DNA-binding transcriptional regulator AlpA